MEGNSLSIRSPDLPLPPFVCEASSSEMLKFEAAIQKKVGVIYITEVFTVLEAVAFKQSCQDLFQQNPHLDQVILDFAETSFIDSSGIGALVICHRLSQVQGARMQLQNVPSQVMMALQMTELDKIFTIKPAALPASVQRRLNNLPSTHASVRSKAKRLTDIVGAIVGLLITGVAWVPIAIAIRTEDSGPILFGQTRCSWMGKRFTIWKFRSMVSDAEALKAQVDNQVEGPLFKNENDPRVTRIGRFLRRTSLDELPQFWNVLKGEMSLVGTRPPTPDEIEQYEVPAWQRLNVKPGMTGEWQVHGRSKVTNFEDVIRLDLRYQENWSFFYDLKLIVKTVLILFSRDSGAV